MFLCLTFLPCCCLKTDVLDHVLIKAFRGRLRGANQANADLIQSKDQLYDMFQQILNVKKFEHQIIFNSLQLDNPDEQAAAIRREVATREETLRDMPRVICDLMKVKLSSSKF